MSNHYNKTKN